MTAQLLEETGKTTPQKNLYDAPAFSRASPG